MKWLSTIKQRRRGQARAREDGARRDRLPAADRRARGARGRLARARARPGGRPVAARRRARASRSTTASCRSAPNMMTGHPGIFAGGDMVPGRAHGHGRHRPRQEGRAPHRRLAARRRATSRRRKHELATFDKLNTWYYADAPRTVQPAARRRPPAARPSTRSSAASTSRTRCSRRAAACRAATASRATTATASAPTTPCSSSASRATYATRSTSTTARAAASASPSARAARSRWCRRRSDARADGDQVGLRLRRGLARDARAARRQGRQPRRDDARAGPRARAGRLHDHHRGVRRLHARRRARRPTGSPTQSPRRSRGWRSARAGGSAIRTTRCWSPCAAGRATRCRG